MRKILVWPDKDWIFEDDAPESYLFQVKSDDYDIVSILDHLDTEEIDTYVAIMVDYG